ncbi:MAG: RNA polymerase sigma factor [Verrucomicrobia bacterium]|nr:RNA polymerase sigma factor [Verrucomicrobiota bacterium]
MGGIVSLGLPAAAPEFTTTHWSVVRAGGDRSSPAAQTALEELCRTYWYPLYVFVRRRGYSPEDAQDLTQEFFARLLQKNSISAAHPGKGRFRCFLLGALKHLLADEHAKAQAKKRGGGQTIISWEQDYAEEQFAHEPVDEQSPDRLYDRRWALTVLDRAATRLRVEFAAAGDASLFEHLKLYVTGKHGAPAYAATASRLGLSESAVKSAIFRLRRRYAELVREEVAQTVNDARELEVELRHLRSVMTT